MSRAWYHLAFFVDPISKSSEAYRGGPGWRNVEITLPDALHEWMLAQQEASRSEENKRAEHYRREGKRAMFTSDCTTALMEARSNLNQCDGYDDKEKFLELASVCWEAGARLRARQREAIKKWPLSLDEPCLGESSVGELTLGLMSDEEEEE